MNAVVVYESYWGNTAEIARAIAEGIGPEAKVLPTDEAMDAVLAPANLIVIGAPILGFSLAGANMRDRISHDAKAPAPPDLTHTSMREWLEAVPKGDARFASFETGYRLSPGGAARKIERTMEAAGYIRLAKHERFLIEASYGPLVEGETERAKQWGADLVAAMQEI